MEQWSGTIIYLLFFFFIMYFMLIRPQQKHQKNRAQMLAKLKVNDNVVTVGGIHGKIVRLKENRVVLRIAEKVEIEVEKNGIGAVLGGDKGD